MRGFPFRGALRGALGVALGAIAGYGSVVPAAASENYPSVLDAQGMTMCPNALTRCLICHDSAAGGEQTANRPFAVTMKDYGLEGKSPRKLITALARLREEDVDQDSDADGMTDLEELAACMNPSGEELSDGPGFGCGARLAVPAGHAPAWPAVVSALVVGGLLLGSARQRAVARRSSRGVGPGKG
jgi:hypothetical protein